MSTRTERQSRERLVANILMAMFVAGLVLYVQGVVNDSDWRNLGLVLIGVAVSAIANFAVRR